MTVCDVIKYQATWIRRREFDRGRDEDYDVVVMSEEGSYGIVR